MGDGDAEGFAHTGLVEDRVMGALRTCRVLAAAYGVELRVVAREVEDGFGEVVPRAHAFIGEVVEPSLIELSTLNDPHDEACQIECRGWGADLVEDDAHLGALLAEA